MTSPRAPFALLLLSFASLARAQDPSGVPSEENLEASTETSTETNVEAASAEVGAGLDAPVPPPPSVSTPPPPLPSSAELAAVEATWEVYHRAAMAIAEGDRTRARQLLAQVASLGDHPAAAPARRLLERLESLERSGGGIFSNEQPSPLARGELVAWHTIGGAGAGALLCAIAECGTVRGWTLSMIGLGAVGGGLALAFSRDGVRPGRAALHGAALRWGYLDTWLLSSVLGLTWKEHDDGFGDPWLDSTNGHAVALLVGHGLGLGSALLVDHFLSPSAGDVGLMDSLHNLKPATITFILGAASAFGFRVAGRRATGALAAACWKRDRPRARRSSDQARPDDARSLAAARPRHVARRRTRRGVPLLIVGSDVAPEALLMGGAAGVVAGFSAAWFATRRMRGPDDEASNVDFAVAPTMGGAQASLQVRLR
ncbi:MAG: hypothetical protein R3B99_11075 [Polyangiales bacterium]